MAESKGLLAKFWALLSRPKTPRGFGDHGNASPDTRPIDEIIKNVEETFVDIDIEGLLDEMSGLITKNQIEQLRVRKDIAKLELIIDDEVKDLQNMEHDLLKKMALRRINSRKKRLERLERIMMIYHDNIDLHYGLSDRLDEARIAGIKKITADQLEEFTVDYEEQKAEHDEIISTAKVMLQSTKLAEEPELAALAKELGID